MKNPVQLTKAIDPIQNSLRPSPWRYRALIFSLAFGIACFAISPTARAVDPPPDGGYPNANTAEGEDALFSLDTRTGASNTAIGFHALYSNITGFSNTASGADALFNTTGDQNTATGFAALYSNTTGYGNTASGLDALYDNTVGFYNTANGISALSFNTTGQNNTASGAGALYSNTTASNNTASGFEALHANTTGSFNTAEGVQALDSNTTGISNTADGAYALFSNTTGINNTANGVNALYYNTTGNENAANGNSALSLNTTGLNNTADGSQALLRNTTGSSNIALGFQAGQNLTTGSNNIDIGNAGVAGESKRIRIGTAGTQTKTFIAGISGATVANGVGVIVGSNGQLGTVVSSERFKEQIKPMDKASEAILSLKPVTFRYKKELDPDGIPQFGLVAEEVAKVNPDLVARDDEGKPYTVRYEAVNAMLLNEFLKEHRKVEQLETKVTRQEKDFQTAIAEQRKEIKALTARLTEQAAQIRKVSEQLELSKFATGRIRRGGPAPRLVDNQ